MSRPRQFGPFEIRGKLGTGGMGIVYKAVYQKTGQTVALKVLSPDLSADEQVRKRFDREMEILKRLDHKNIVRYYGGGRIGNQHFYAMELMEGGSLDAVLKKRGRLSWEQTIEVGKAVARALEHAHYYGIVHRDLKPANLFLSKDNRLKLGDFGIARDTERTALTAAGKTVGTYAYMAPEQISGKPPVSRKTDQYALGCVLFELLTGRPPFEGDNAAQMLMQHLELKPPRVTSLVPDCPLWLENVINKLLEKDPDDRYFDARAVWVALDEVVKKEIAGESVVKQTVRGDVTVATKGEDPELKRLLRRKKKKRKKKKQAFYEQTWFLALCLALLVGFITWAVWPLSAEERFARGQTLMEQAAELQPDDEQRAYLFQEAEEHFHKLLDRYPDSPQASQAREYLVEIRTDRLRRQAEARLRTNRRPRSVAEGLYMKARRDEIAGDRISALDKYRKLKELVQGREKDRPYFRLAQQRMDAIYDQNDGSDSARQLIEDALRRADQSFRAGNTVKANEIWNAIVSFFGNNKELEPLVNRARARLAGKPAGETSRDGSENEIGKD